MATAEQVRPVLEEGRRAAFKPGTRIQIDVPVRTSLALNGAMFAYSGYFLYHTLKGVYKLNKGE